MVDLVFFEVMSEPIPPEDANRVDAKSQELMAEFHAYRDEIMAGNPDDPKLSNERIIFESWALQKIAGLHCVVQDLVKEVYGTKKRRPRL
jgi:hypothetical protein